MNDFTHAVVSAFALIARLDPELSGIVALSLRVSLSASVIALVIGAPFGAWLAVSRFHGRQMVIVLTGALLGLPPENWLGLDFACGEATRIDLHDWGTVLRWFNRRAAAPAG